MGVRFGEEWGEVQQCRRVFVGKRTLGLRLTVTGHKFEVSSLALDGM